MGDICWECDMEAEEIHHHHVVPRSRGGTKTVGLCLECHGKAHHRKKNMHASKLTKEAIQTRLADGGRWGRAPLGFKVVDGELVATELASIIHEAVKMSEAGVRQRPIMEFLTLQAPEITWSQPKVSRILKQWKNDENLRALVKQSLQIEEGSSAQ